MIKNNYLILYKGSVIFQRLDITPVVSSFLIFLHVTMGIQAFQF